MKINLRLPMLLLVITLSLVSFNLNAQKLITSIDTSYVGIKKVVINADFCAVKLIDSQSDTLSFNGAIKANENAEGYDMKIENTDDMLSVVVTRPSQWNSHWGEIVLELPKGVAVVVESKSGKIDAHNLSGNDVSFTSKSGHAVFSDVVGNINITSTNGDISLNKIQGDTKGKTKTGNLNVNNYTGKVNLTSDKGTVMVNNVAGTMVIYGGDGIQEIEAVTGSLSTKSTSGSVKISHCEGEIKCRTFSAQQKLFQCEGVYTIESSKGNIVGTRIKFTDSSSFKATEGGIKIQTNTKENVRYELSSNNSILRALGKSKKKSLKIGKGDILITSVTTTGAQSYY